MSDSNASSPIKMNKVNYYSWCVTDRKEVKFGYVWAIKKFSYLEETTGECLESTTFSASENDKNKWRLVLYPRGHKREHTTSVSLFLRFLGPVPEGKSIVMNAAFQLSVLDKNREKSRMRRVDKIHHFTANERDWGFERFIKRDELMKERNGLIVNDEVTFYCKIAILTKPSTFDGYYDDALFDKDIGCSRLTDDLGRLLNSKKFSDVVLVADDKELHVHKAFLAARSPVFAAMFEHDMKERNQNRVVISDITYAVLEELMRFIYTGKTPAMEDEKLAMQLLAAAEKYSLEDLKVMCEQALCLNLTSENVAQLVRLAILYNAGNLKARLVEFVKSLATDEVLNKLLHDLIIPQLVEGTRRVK